MYREHTAIRSLAVNHFMRSFEPPLSIFLLGIGPYKIFA